MLLERGKMLSVGGEDLLRSQEESSEQVGLHCLVREIAASSPMVEDRGSISHRGSWKYPSDNLSY